MSRAVTSQTFVAKNQEIYAKKNIDISKGDYFLFGGNVASLVSSALSYTGYNTQLFQTVTNITQLTLVLGESLTTAPSFDRLYAALPGLALFGTRLFIDHQARSNPSLRIISLGINAYGTCILAKKAIAEAIKCYHLSSKDKISNSEMVKVYVIHGTNAIASLFRTCMKYMDYKTLEFSEASAVVGEKTKNAYLDKYPSATHEEIKQVNDRIDFLVEKVKQHGAYAGDGAGAVADLHALLERFRHDCPYKTVPNFPSDVANNHITNEIGNFKTGPDQCGTWKQYYQSYPDATPEEAFQFPASMQEEVWQSDCGLTYAPNCQKEHETGYRLDPDCGLNYAPNCRKIKI